MNQDGQAIDYVTDTRQKQSHQSTEILHGAREADGIAKEKSHKLTDRSIPIDNSNMPDCDSKGGVSSHS